MKTVNDLQWNGFGQSLETLCQMKTQSQCQSFSKNSLHFMSPNALHIFFVIVIFISDKFYFKMEMQWYAGLSICPSKFILIRIACAVVAGGKID